MERTCRERGIVLPEPTVEQIDTTPVGYRPPPCWSPASCAGWPCWSPCGFLWYIGNYGFLGDSATLLSAHGYNISSSILFLGVGGIGYPVGAIVMAWVADATSANC